MKATSLQTLAKLTADNARKRPKPAKPVKPNQDVERYYHAQLRSLVRDMAKEVNAEVMPVIKSERDDYTATPEVRALTIDGMYTEDDWARRVIDAIRRVKDRFFTPVFEAAYNRIARTFVGRVDDTTTRELVKSVNNAVGVDIRPMLSERDMDDYIQASIAENVSLIRSIPEQFFGRIENTIYNGLKDGVYPSVIADQLQADYGVSYRRARTIAGDQFGKIRSQVTRKRQQQAGIKYFKWVTSQDERVSGRPGGKYPQAKIKCWEISKRDIGYGEGVYPIDKGAKWAGEERLFPGTAHVNCRCTQSVVFEWQLPDNK